MEPGEIYLIDFEAAGVRPAIVVSRESLNRGRRVLVVPCTTARFATRSQLPNCVPFQAGQFGFTADCVAQCENLAHVPITDFIDLDTGPIGQLDDMTLRDVIRAIGFVIQSDCEPE